jgi:hypothetical protein
MMGCSKLYVDFGHHPGKDRMPREAARAGCCILTSRTGAANFEEDVPIPGDCKFQTTDKAVPRIASAIRDMLSNFDVQTKRFERYRQAIAVEKTVFENEVRAFASFVENEIVVPAGS